MPKSKRRSQLYLLLSTVASRQEAQRISKALIHKKLAACVSIVPGIHSIFRWQNTISRAREILLLIKTDARHLKQVEQAIRKHHSYQVPEIIACPIVWGERSYLDWLYQSLS